MDNKHQLHVVFFPFMAYGHMIPTLDIARLFAARGVKATIITTPFNVPTFSRAIKKNTEDGVHIIDIEIFKFPTTENGLPEGCENLEQAMKFDMVEEFCDTAAMLREQLEQYLEQVRPSCLVADMFFPWANESAAKFSIPRLVFHGVSFFALCSMHIIREHKPFKCVSTDEDSFVIPYLPHEIHMLRSQIPEGLRKDDQTKYKTRWEKIAESELSSYGVIANTFYELEPDFADFFRENLRRKAWHIGPVSLCNRNIEAKIQRGEQGSMDEHECIKWLWLNVKRPGSVMYICFGSSSHSVPSQVQEIARALELCGYEFIWVIRKADESGKIEECLPPGFEQRTKGKGLIIRGWAPQVLILEHEAIGAFVTHCGWNSILEGVSAGLPLVTWPIFADQFYNEKLVNNVLKIGVPVGAKKWSIVPSNDEVIEHDAIAKAFREIMVGEEAEERRSRAKKLKEMAFEAIDEGGSSHSDLNALIKELRNYHT